MANNIITAAYSSSNITYTKPAYQYDYGMILKFSGIELPQAYEVHFSNTEFCGESISRIGDESGVTIPDEMFLSGNPIYAWTYLHTGEDDGETVYKAVISVNKRAKPSDLEPTPVQQDAITQAIAALNVAVEQTAADVVAAGESAEAAAGSAETAGQAKDDAVEAKDKAVEAKNAAETAQGKAEDAQRAAEQAAGSVLGLTADATVDANVGTPSVSVSVTTESDHKNMSFAFHNLKGVQGDTGVGISSVVLNADYTLTITLTNGVSYTTTSIRGEVGATPNLTIGTVSTLPEGSQATATITGTSENPVLNLGIPVGDTGVGIASVEKTGTSGLVDTYTITYTDGTTSTFEVTNGADGEVSEEELETALIDKADVITSSASGEIVTIQDGGDDLPVVDLKVSLLPVQSGSGDPSPTNVRPISGWTGVEVTRTAENLYGGQSLADSIVNAVDNQTNTYKGEDTNGRYVTFAAGSQIKNKVFAKKFKPNTAYTAILKMTRLQSGHLNSNIRVGYTDGTGSVIYIDSTSETGIYTVVFTTNSAKSVENFSLTWGGGRTYLYYDESGIFEGVLTADDFKPYVGNTYPISWQSSAGTVYGCNIDPVSGVLKVDRITDTITKDSAWYGFSTGTGNASAVVQLSDYSNVKYVDGSSSRNGAISSTGKEAQNYWINARQNEVPGDGDMCFAYSSTGQLRFHRTDITNITDLASFQANFPDTQICYQLKNPVTYQLTPVQIQTLLGSNNFWSNGNGSLDLEYRCDTKLYIEQLTKPTEDDMVANQNITASSFFMVGNRLFLSTVAIAQGATIVPGTNCTEISLADALNSLNS